MGRAYAITGVASGIGAELVSILKDAGHTVVGFDRIAPTAPVDHFIEVDLAHHAALRKAAAETPIKLDGLCNNAGVPPRAGQEALILQVNFTGTRAFTQAMLPHLKPGACIVNMASRAGHGWRDHLDQIKALAAIHDMTDISTFVATQNLDATRCYNLSKEAVILWTQAMTEPMIARNLRINSLSPGGVSTGILSDFKRAFGDQMVRNVARAGRPGEAVEIARIAAFMLSPDSHWIKGADIPIDGGMGAFNLSDALGLDTLRLEEDM